MEIAIITGASSGLGTWYARLLDSEGLDEIWLIARREKRLATIAQLLTTRTRVLACDLTETAAVERIAQLLAETAQPEIRWLINAAGFGRISSCAELPANDAAHMIDLNCRAAVLLTGAALPFMGAGSHIMNICSCAAFQPLPSLALYAATKAFLLSYTRALSSELAPQGILVTAVCPYWIRDTEFIARAEQTDTTRALRHFPFACAAETVARRSLRAAKNGIGVVTPDAVSLLHRIAAKLLPQGLLIHLVTLWHRL